MAVNMIPHPPSGAGNDVMFKALNIFLNKMSRKMNANVDATDVTTEGNPLLFSEGEDEVVEAEA